MQTPQLRADYHDPQKDFRIKSTTLQGRYLFAVCINLLLEFGRN